MLSTNIKEATKAAHQGLEKKVVLKLKAIRSNADYADLLKHFYAYFNAVEKAIAPYITNELLPDHAERRNSEYLKEDIEELGASVSELPAVNVPEITNTLQALGAMYVMEGSIMGGPIIVQMLAKYGVTTGVSFFSGYGEATGMMWGKFVAVMNNEAKTEDDETIAVLSANDTFQQFSDVFGEVEVA
ncbi:biliverdin-producing heme oxygenase [Pedobacter metabolipauper]|uniref:Heme oxygenase n=1 Tax=Pedobacter metabolipauper TaxID=425513 RepID=A0A4R6SYM5_9SPHI|nr:biliverdin-producing heme oxygenase [Pedobacter metabolipauper]TDQ09784.1 heme oxygenase [Pedobacter metabolipauper]